MVRPKENSVFNPDENTNLQPQIQPFSSSLVRYATCLCLRSSQSDLKQITCLNSSKDRDKQIFGSKFIHFTSSQFILSKTSHAPKLPGCFPLHRTVFHLLKSQLFLVFHWCLLEAKLNISPIFMWCYFSLPRVTLSIKPLLECRKQSFQWNIWNQALWLIDQVHSTITTDLKYTILSS